MIVLKVTEDLDWIETIISVIEIFFLLQPTVKNRNWTKHNEDSFLSR